MKKHQNLAYMGLIAQITFTRKYTMKCLHMMMTPLTTLTPEFYLSKRLTRTCRSSFGGAAPLQKEGSGITANVSAKYPSTRSVINSSTIFFKQMTHQVFHKEICSLASVSEDQLINNMIHNNTHRKTVIVLPQLKIFHM